ncbi:twin-arginine translocase TatA/TatE family subunit [Gordonibacter sp.]|uniref:twin-arginine translocase TatA/TatE family subunit n=1 Tax=Gordonibacter sp. TaxID=1968902 RepID=UPI002FC94451
MKILGMGMPELLIILAVVLLIFGPKHLPKLGKAVGSTVKNLRDGLGEKKIEGAEEGENIVEATEAEASDAVAETVEEVAPKPTRTVKARKTTTA